MTIDPKISAILNLVLAVLGGLAGATAAWTSLLGQGQAEQVIGIIGLAVTVLAAINAGLHGLSSPKAGPLVSG